MFNRIEKIFTSIIYVIFKTDCHTLYFQRRESQVSMQLRNCSAQTTHTFFKGITIFLLPNVELSPDEKNYTISLPIEARAVRINPGDAKAIGATPRRTSAHARLHRTYQDSVDLKFTPA